MKTPVMDALAARGTMFTRAYTNCPICVPARASFATGRYVHDCGYWDNADPYDGAVPSWGHRLIAQGHRCLSIGKLHYRSVEDDNGFDEEKIPLHVVGGHGDLIGLVRDNAPERAAVPKYAADVGRGESSYTRYDRQIAAEAYDWLTGEGARQERPFVLFVSFVCPHFPLIAPDEFYDLYAGADIGLPPLYDEASRPTHRYYREFDKVMGYDRYFDEERAKEAQVAYMGLVSFLDANIGTVLKGIEDAGLSGDTRIVYTSDHGEALGKRGIWGKSTMFDESARIPLIVTGEGVAAGKRVATPVSLVDGHPTILECVGAVPAPEDADLPGRSLFAVAEEAQDENRVAFSEYHAAASVTGNFMVRKGRWKYVVFVGMEPELFDMEADPDETVNLAADPAHADVLAEMDRALRAICDPEEVDARARADQSATIERHGGREAVLAKGDFGYSPAPGQEPGYS